MDMEISKMLTISTGHISEKTAEELGLAADPFLYISSEIDLTVYEKGGYGYIIFVPEDMENRNIPDDLKACLQLAKENECEWLCLDCDGLEIDGLEIHEWIKERTI